MTIDKDACELMVNTIQIISLKTDIIIKIKYF